MTIKMDPTADQVSRPSLRVRVLTAPIRFYQHATVDRPSPCRYTPSCSTYAMEAIQAHGAVKGGYLAVRRLLRCNPWGSQGYDPVPPSHRHSPSHHEKVH